MTSGRPYSILITDDDPAARESFREMFEVEGFQTLLAEASMVIVLLVVSGGAAAKAYPQVSTQSPNTIAVLVFILPSPRKGN